MTDGSQEPGLVDRGGRDREHANWWWRSARVVPGRAAVFDLDGVLSDAARRQHHLRRPRRDWDAFFEACGDDEVIGEVAALLSLLDPHLQIVLLTARPARVQEQTLGWLERHGLRWDLLVMRHHGDYVPSRSFKQSSVRALRTAGFEPVLAFEDDRRNYEMFHREGIPCVYIHSGYYD